MFTSRHTHEEKKRSSTSSTTRITSKQHNNKWQLSIIIISFICFIIFFIIVGITSSRSFYSSPQSFLQDRAKDLHSRSRGQMMQQEKPTRDRQLRIEGTGVGCTGKGGTCRDPIIRSSNEDDKKMKLRGAGGGGRRNIESGSSSSNNGRGSPSLPASRSTPL